MGHLRLIQQRGARAYGTAVLLSADQICRLDKFEGQVSGAGFIPKLVVLCHSAALVMLIVGRRGKGNLRKGLGHRLSGRHVFS